MDMKKLMSPKSMVVIGASMKPGIPGGATKAAVAGAISDHVYYLNPNYDELNGRKCYHALSELPEVVDCMVICTAARFVPQYLKEGGMMGIRAAVVFASGFSEERSQSARKLADEVKTICENYDIALCGPNCVGIMNGVDKVSVSAGDEVMMPLLSGEPRRGIAVIAQSGYITSGFSVPDVSKLAYVVSAGNSTMCCIEDYMCYFAEDENVTCIAVYMEGGKKPERLVEALEMAAKNRKPVVVLKAGMTEKGSFAAASHTGSLAGNYKVYESVFKKFGVIVTKSLQEFVSTARMFAVLDGNFPKKPGIGGINFSGGENTLCADTCARYGIDIPDFAEETVSAIRALVPSYSTPSNPLDATTTMFSEHEKVEKLLQAISMDPNVGLITLGNDVGIPSEPKDYTCSEIMSKMRKEGTLTPAVVIPSFEKMRNKEVRDQFESAGIPVLSTGDMAYQAVAHLLEFAAFCPENVTLKLALHESFEKDGATVSLSEAESKERLVPYGISVPAQALAKTAEDIENCLQKVTFPLAMKVESPDILHKTEAGGVKLGIASEAEAKDAFLCIMKSCMAYRADAKITGVMLEEMAKDGVEVIVGVQNDPLFGPVVLVGLGGVFVEVFQDTALYPCPLTEKEAMRMIQSLKGYRLLTGCRGSEPADVEALADLIVKVSDYAAANKDTLMEMDLNPVRVHNRGDGVTVIDALIVEKQEKERE